MKRREGVKVMTVIESKQNARVKHVRKLVENKKYRAACGLFVAEGEKMLEEAVSSAAQIEEIFIAEETTGSSYVESARSRGAVVHIIGSAVMKSISDVETPQGLVFTCRAMARQQTLDGACKILILDALQDPGNLGTILRTADAFALDAVVLCEGCVDVYSPKVVRATMGAIFRLRTVQMPLADCVCFCDKQGIMLCATVLSDKSVPIRQVDLTDSCAVIIGNEGNGVSAYGMQHATRHVKIPMAGSAESLNAAVAASIVIYEMMG